MFIFKQTFTGWRHSTKVAQPRNHPANEVIETIIIIKNRDMKTRNRDIKMKQLCRQHSSFYILLLKDKVCNFSFFVKLTLMF